MPSTSPKQHRLPSKLELAWVGGVFCGEGSTSLHKPHRFIGLRCTVGQAGIDSEPPSLLTRLMEIFPHSKIYRVASSGRHKAHHRAQWQWVIRDFVTAQAFIAMTWQWLTYEKQDQAITKLKEYHAYRAAKGTRVYAQRQPKAA